MTRYPEGKHADAAFMFCPIILEKDVTDCDRSAEEARNFSKGNARHEYRASTHFVPGRYSKALLNYLAASNLPRPTYTRHVAHLIDVTSRSSL